MSAEPLARFRRRYRQELGGTAAAAAIGTTLAGLGFAYLLVPGGLAACLPLAPHVLVTLAVSAVAWWLVARRIWGPIDRYLEVLLGGGALDTRRPSDTDWRAAFDAARRLGPSLALLTYGLVAADGVLLAALGAWQLGIGYRSTLLGVTQGLLALGGLVLGELCWHRRTLGPLLGHLALRQLTPSPPPPLSFGGRNRLYLGGLNVVACGLASLGTLAALDGGGVPRVLVAFFLLLGAASLGLGLLAAEDLVAPVRRLAERAGALGRGNWSEPMLGAFGDGDEVGRLAFAFEEARRTLAEKLRSTTEINLSLEREVGRRTAELEYRNQELRGALDALRRTQDELVRSEKLASMGRLVAGIAHEINNPVNAIVNTAGPLGEALAALDGEGRHELAALRHDALDMVRVIRQGAERTKTIVQALHSYSRGDDREPSDVDLHQRIDESLDLLRHELGPGIVVERAYGEMGRVRGFAGPLQQVFVNLLSNAAQALGPKGGTIRIETARRGDEVVFSVADDGPGIAPDVLPHIFDPFFTTKEVGRGSGLGLSIVHGIVERHGGAIAVDSQPGKGTRFTVTLPSKAGPLPK